MRKSVRRAHAWSACRSLRTAASCSLMLSPPPSPALVCRRGGTPPSAPPVSSRLKTATFIASTACAATSSPAQIPKRKSRYVQQPVWIRWIDRRDAAGGLGWGSRLAPLSRCCFRAASSAAVISGGVFSAPRPASSAERCRLSRAASICSANELSAGAEAAAARASAAACSSRFAFCLAAALRSSLRQTARPHSRLLCK